MLEIVHAIGQLLLLIGLPEEPAVVEARPQDALIAEAHQAIGILAGVHDRDELRTRGGEVILMVPHHCGADLFPKLQESGIEAAGDGGGVFGQVDQFFEQAGIGLDLDRQPGNSLLDLGAPFRG